MTTEKKRKLSPVVNQLTDLNIRQPLLTDGREMWQVLDFSKKPELEWGEDGRDQAHRLYMTLLNHRVETRSDISRFVDKYRTYINNLPPKGKAFFVQDFHEHFYINGKYAMADTFLDSLGMNENQTEQINYWTAIYSMGSFSDMDGVSTWTEVGTAAKIAKQYPHFLNDPVFKDAARKGVEIEITNASRYSNDIDRINRYVEAGLVEMGEFELPTLKGVVTAKLGEQLVSGDGEFARKIKRNFGVTAELIFSDEMQAKAEKGFWYRLSFMPDESRMLAEDFLPEDFLLREEVKQKITEQYIAGIKDKLGNAIEIASNFNAILPENIVGENIWSTDLAASLQARMIADIAEGWDVAESYASVFGLPVELKNSQEMRKAAVLNLQHSVIWARRETAEKLVVTLGLGSDIWHEVATPEFLEKLFEDNDLAKFVEFMAEGSEPLKIDSAILKKFVDKIILNGEQLNSRTLDRLADLRNAIPEVSVFLDVLAGADYPQDATVNDLLNMCDNCLVTSAVTGLYMFTKDEVARVTSMLDSGNSHDSVAFFNVLKRCGFFDNISNDEKDRLLFWVTKWGEQAKTESLKADTQENKKAVRQHWGHYHRLKEQRGPEVISGLYRYKADCLAVGIEMFGRTRSIDEIAEVLDRTDPNKLYLIYSKRLMSLLKDEFRKNKKK